MRNHRDTLLAQYANSPTISTLVDRFHDWLDIQPDLSLFLQRIWDIETAQGYGLDVWGRIVGIGRYLDMPTSVAEFGFAEQREVDTPNDATPQPFDGGGAMADGAIVTTTMRLSDHAYRKLILAKAATNIGDASAPNINRAMTILLGDRGRCYVQDNGNMTINYVFEFALSPMEKAVVQANTVIPRPAGVRVLIVEAVTGATFGFAQSGLEPFGSGTFFIQQ